MSHSNKWQQEKQRQEQFPWERSKFYSSYQSILGYYKVVSCLEHSRGDNLLDLACGDGLLTEMFSKHFSRVVGVDASREHLEIARKRIPTAEFHECLIEVFETDERFDTILLLDILEHVIDPILLLEKAANLLSDQGVLIAHVPNANAINRKIAVHMGTLKSCTELSPFDLDIAGHRRYYTLDTLREDVQKTGLQLVASGGIFYKSLSTPQIDWFLQNGPWEEGGFGWGRVGEEKTRDWRAEFCRACYEIGKEQPEDCNVLYAVMTK
ncbi:MAG: class I SAM-dependent methyltransferase [Phycisphaerae bacterium]|nr:class I SAM-dependent methyltransferase [Phycisphaerae bacterium]